MKYFIGCIGVPLSSRKEIDFSTYNQIISAYELIKLLNSVEERYDVVIKNYCEYEKMVCSITIDSMVFYGSSILDMLTAKREVIRLLNNLLSSCRLYLDQNDKNIEQIKPDFSKVLKKKKSAIFDDNISYRLLEYLRNSMQHCTMPISLLFRRDFLSLKKNDKVLETIIVELDKDILIDQDAKHLKKVQKDIDTFKSSGIPLKDNIRSYIECMAKILEFIREETMEEYNSSVKCMEDIFNTYQINRIPIESEKVKIIDIFCEDDGKETVVIKHIANSIIKNIVYLRKVNLTKKKYSSVVIQN